jgi:hypothetical protein
MSDESLVEELKRINQKEEESRNVIYQREKKKHKNRLLQTCKQRRQVLGI